MNSYNGFSPEQRQDAQDWINAELSAGRLTRPRLCCACGQDHGSFDFHAEDYSEPFGPQTVRYPLCYPCHMMVHCRFRNPKAWVLYRAKVATGFRVAVPFLGRNWPRFTGFLNNPEGIAWIPSAPQVGLVLDAINDGRA